MLNICDDKMLHFKYVYYEENVLFLTEEALVSENKACDWEE
jgi:hypothetical protein